MLAIYRNCLKRIQQAEVFLAVLMFGVIVGVIALQVLVRYLFNKPFPWPEELASLLLIYLTFLTADIVYKEKGHIAIDYFVNFFPVKMKLLVSLGVHLAICVFIIVLIPNCINLLKMQFGHTTAAVLTLPKSFWSLPVPIAFISMLFTTLFFMLEEMSELRKHNSGRREI